jgi:glycerophosphoryl diester phosphodiesterase
MISFINIIILLVILLVTGHLFLWKSRDPSGFNIPTPSFIGHRGAPIAAPENTLPAYQEAIAQGLTTLEIDIVPTLDNILVCSHNFDLERETDGTGFIDEITFSALQKIKTGVRSHPDRPGRISALVDVLNTIPESIRINIEIKSRGLFDIRPAVILARYLKSRDPGRIIMVSSFNPMAILAVKMFNRNISTGIIYETLNSFYLSRVIHPSWIIVDAELISAQLINWAKKHGMSIGAWTVNTKPAVNWLLAKGVNGIFTDRPEYCDL